MNENSTEQIKGLLTRVGMIMEDLSGNALTLMPTDTEFIERLDTLARGIDAASNLLRAAAVLYADQAGARLRAQGR